MTTTHPRENKILSLATAIFLTAALSYVSAAPPPPPTNHQSPVTTHATPPPTPRYHFLVEPAFMRPPVQIPIPGTGQTLVTPALLDGDDVTYVQPTDYEANREGIDALARQNASEDLATLEPRYVRDDRGTIQFAVVDSDQPFVASTVFADDFIETFETTLGPDLLVAIPNRFRIYVFPALASRFADIADSVLADHGMTAYPVSKEVFRVLPNHTLEAIGTYDDR